MTINEGVEVSHGDAVKKGFYTCKMCNGSGIFIPADGGYTESCSACNGTGVGDRNVGEALMLVVSELGEAMEAHRKGRFVAEDVDISKSMSDEDFEEDVKDKFSDEIADTVIRLFDLCGYLNIDLENNILRKLEYNRGRPFKHGKRY